MMPLFFGITYIASNYWLYSKISSRHPRTYTCVVTLKMPKVRKCNNSTSFMISRIIRGHRRSLVTSLARKGCIIQYFILSGYFRRQCHIYMGKIQAESAHLLALLAHMEFYTKRFLRTPFSSRTTFLRECTRPPKEYREIIEYFWE